MRYVEDNPECVNSVNVSLVKGCGPILHGLIDDSTTDVLVNVFQVALTGILAVGGMVTNTLNIVVFIKMGLNDSVNISLLGLSVADYCSLVFSLWEAVCFNPWFVDTSPIVFTEIEYITGCWPHVCFVRVASYITAYITFERCLCIALPLKVKTIITTARAKVIIVLIFFLVLVSSIPEYYVSQLRWKFYPSKNRTMLGIYFIEDREKFERVTLVLNNVALQCFSFMAVVVCTAILVIQLNRKAKWRQQSAKGENNTGSKEKKVVKMIIFISVIFITSNLPSCMVFVAMSITHELHPTGNEYNMFYVVWALVYVMEGINSTVNIFVYLHMSSKFKATFYKTFLCRDPPADTSRSEASQSKADTNQDNI